jgi:diaminopimelate decarboxylase
MNKIASDYNIRSLLKYTANIPLYVFDFPQIIKNVKKYSSTQANFKTIFSVKSCYHIPLLKKILPTVDGYDVANYNEFKHLKTLNLKNKIVSIAGPSYSATDVKHIIKTPIKQLILVFDHIDQYKDCKKFTKLPNVFFMLRVSENQLNNKSTGWYGFQFKELVPLTNNKKFIGTHIHIPGATNMRTIKNYLNFLRKSLKIPNVTTINFGGGQHHYDWFKLKKYLKNKNITYIIEPGQPFFINCISVIGKILTIKKQKNFYNIITNLSDFNHLQWCRDKQLVINKTNKKDKIHIYGPTCAMVDYHGIVVNDINNFKVNSTIMYSNLNPLCVPMARSFNGVNTLPIHWKTA